MTLFISVGYGAIREKGQGHLLKNLHYSWPATTTATHLGLKGNIIVQLRPVLPPVEYEAETGPKLALCSSSMLHDSN